MQSLIKPKIIVSSYDDLDNPYYGGGGAVAVHEVFRRLSKFYDITVLTGKYPNSRNKIFDNISYRRIGTTLFGPKIGQLIFQLLLPLFVRREEFDLWVENFTPPFSTACLQLFTRKPVVGLVHMLAGEDMLRKYKIPFFILEYLGLKTYKYFIVISKVTQYKIVKFNRKSSLLLAPNGVSVPAKIINYKKRDKKYAVFIGRIEINQKGLDLLIKAFDLIMNKQNFSADAISLKLKIAGGGNKEEINKLNMLINSYHLQNYVELVGRVSGLTKHNLFQQALFAIVPSRFETFSLSALEIFSYGIPLISFDIEGLKWVPKSCILKIPQIDAKNLATAIFKLYQDTNLRNNLSQKSLQFIKNYSWEDTTLKYKSFLTRILRETV